MPPRGDGKCLDCGAPERGKGLSVCPPCNVRRVRAWQLANPERHKANVARAQIRRSIDKRHRPAVLLRKYGLTPEGHAAILLGQNGRCAGCGIPAHEASQGVLQVDHDHVSGAVRGLLCSQCNKVLGLAHDDPQCLRNLAAYLDRSAVDSIEEAS